MNMAHVHDSHFWPVFLLAPFLIALPILPAVAVAQTNFSVGVAKAEITPNPPTSCPFTGSSSDPIPVASCEIKLSGIGIASSATGVESPLWVRVLSIQDITGRRFVLVALDLIDFQPSFAEDIRKRAGLAPEEILVNASHTHGGPVTGGSPGLMSVEGSPDLDYLEQVKVKTVMAIQQARSSASTATLRFGRGPGQIAAYRRADGYLSIMDPYPNQTLDVLEARKTSGSVLAVAFFYGCHPVVLFGQGLISADFPDAARTTIESALMSEGSSDALALFFQGFGGDLNPLVFNQKIFQSTPVSPTVQDKNQAGSLLAAEVMSVREGPTMRAVSGRISVVRRTIQLPLNPFFPGWSSYGVYSLPTDLEILQIGDDPSSPTAWTLAASSHEVVSEFAGQVRNQWPVDAQASVTLLGYSNSVTSYLPTQRMIDADANPPYPVGTTPGMYYYEGYDGARYYYQRLPGWDDGQFAGAMGPIGVLLNDHFNDNSTDQSLWNIGTLQSGIMDTGLQVNETDDRLEILPRSSFDGLAYNGYVSSAGYDLTGRQVSVSVASGPLNAGEEMVFSAGPDSENLYQFSIQGDALYAVERMNGASSSYYLGAFDVSANQYLRIRHDTSTGAIYWESSRDRVLWRTNRSSMPQFALTAVKVELVAGTFGSVASPAVLAFDDLRLESAALPTCPLTDNFDDDIRNAKWTVNTLSKVDGSEVTDPAVKVTETSGQLEITPRTSTAGLRYNGYVSSSTYSLIGAAASVQIAQTPDASTSAEMGFSVGADGDNLHRFNIHDGQFWATEVYGGIGHTYWLGAYDIATYPYLRLRNDPGTGLVLYEGSADTTSWQVLHQALPNFDLRSVRIELIAGTYVSVSAPGVAKFDNFQFSRTYSPLSETFDAIAVDSTQWIHSVLSEAPRPNNGILFQPYDSAVAVRQYPAMSITPRSDAVDFSYNGYLSTGTEDLRGARASIDVAQTLNSASSAEIVFSIGPHGRDRYRYSIQAGTLHAQELLNGTLTDHLIGGYDHQGQRYLRIRHDSQSNAVLWDASADRQTWTCVYGCSYGVVNMIDLTAARIEIVAGTYTAVTSPGVAILDDFRIEW
jgi:hypothetical protein